MSRQLSTSTMRVAQLEAMQSEYSDLLFTARDEDDAYYIDGNLSEAAAEAERDSALEQNIVTLRNRVNELGVAEPVVPRWLRAGQVRGGCEWVLPPAPASGARRVLYCCGGGYTACQPQDYRGLASRLAAATGWRRPAASCDWRWLAAASGSWWRRRTAVEGGDQQQPSAHGDKLDGFRSFHGMLSREFPTIIYSTESGGGDGRPRLDIRSPTS